MSDPTVVIGAGPAGLSCALALATHGHEAVLIDDNARAGGQYLRQLPATYHVSSRTKLHRDQACFDALARALEHPQVRTLPATLVWGLEHPRTLCYASPTVSGRIQASNIVIATGAQEKSLPFPGWTLPGVMSAGGCLNLMKGQGMIPTGRVVVAGNGPLVLVAAASLIAAGADVVCVLEAQSDMRLVSLLLAGLWAAPSIVRTGIGYRTRIRVGGPGLRTGWMVCAAQGEDALTRVAIAPVGQDGRPDLQRQVWIATDTLVTGYGLIPGSETARLFGCRMVHDPALNGPVPIRDHALCTSVAGIYAIGDGAGIGGAQVAMLEGQLAAYAIMKLPVPKPLAARYRRLDTYRRKLNLAYQTRTPLMAAHDETIICRCEELTLGQLKNDPSAQHGSLDALKISSRLGMGRCQGRYCLHAASVLLGLTDSAQHPRMRAPLKPVALDWLANDADAGPAREPDEAHATTLTL